MSTSRVRVAPFRDSGELKIDSVVHSQWLNAILNSDIETIEMVLRDCEDKSLLLNGYFTFPDKTPAGLPAPTDTKRTDEYTFPHSWHIAVVFGSNELVHFFIQHGCDVLLVDSKGRNVCHCLAYLAFMRPDCEDEVLQKFGIICNAIPGEALLKMLQQEEKDHGRRPAEYAMHLGQTRLLTEIIFTKAFLTNIEYRGSVSTYWFDITEYEGSRERIYQSPIILCGMIDRSHTADEHFKALFLRGAGRFWFQFKLRALSPLLFIWFLHRFFFMLVYYLADSAVLMSEESYLSVNSSLCIVSGLGTMTVGQDFGYFCVAYCIVYSASMIVFDVVENYYIYFKNSRMLIETPKGRKRHTVHIIFYRFSQFVLYVIVLINLVVRWLRLRAILFVPPLFDNVSYLIILFCFTWSMMQFIQLLPVVGPFTVSLQRMLANLLGFLCMFSVFAAYYSAIFDRLVNQKKPVCEKEFASITATLYSTFRTLINTLDFRSFLVQDPFTLMLAHISFVFTGSILLINLLIALFSSTVSWTENNRDLILCVQRLSMISLLELRLSYVADKLFRKYQSRFFVQEKGRIYIKADVVNEGGRTNTTGSPRCYRGLHTDF